MNVGVRIAGSWFEINDYVNKLRPAHRGRVASRPLTSNKAQANKFCSLADLTNEASVEARIVGPLLDDLGYAHSDIRLKTSISELAVGKGSKKVLYRPDYVLTTDGIPTVVIDAKAPSESLEEWESQCSSYCLEINRLFDYNPVTHFVLTNGVLTSIHAWDKKKPLLDVAFQELSDASPEYAELRSLLSRKATAAESKKAKKEIDAQDFQLEPVTLDELHEKFQRMHRTIWQSEKKGPSAAFEELMKVVFVKIEKDRQLHEKLGTPPKPKYRDVVFSTHWIAAQTENESPVNDPLFTNLANSLEADIAAGKKKRVFDPDEQLDVSPDTIRKIVKEIEHVDFLAMEEDIHGRMFEAFLDATVRGKDIGQFFTPRDIVDLMVRLADPQVTKDGADTVLDACCGSGGFLIGSMRLMLSKLDKIKGLSSTQKEKLRRTIVNRSLYGIDAGSDPAMYRIARMNMYLHGDGGSHIYHADSLDKNLGKVGRPSVEINQQLEELRGLILKDGKRFDVILSNPPFSLVYSRDDSSQAEILGQYEVSVDRENGKILNKLLSSVMFLERYRDLVVPGGKIFAVIDESVLSGSSYQHVRNYLRKHFLIRGVVSLPGDTFRRASARVKTSILILQAKDGKETQDDLFMSTAIYLGVEPKTARRIGMDVGKLPEKKKQEAERLVKAWRDYEAGKDGPYVVPFSSIADRMDVKFCLGDTGRKKEFWISSGLAVTTIGKVLTPADDRAAKVSGDDYYQFLRVTYDGDVIDGELVLGDECSYNTLYRVETWDLVLSNIGVGRGATGLIPPFHAGKWVSNEYTILRASSKEEAVYYSNLLRTKEILGDVLASTTGMNRGRIRWETIEPVAVPVYKSGNKEIKDLVADLEAFWAAHEEFTRKKRKHVTAVSAALKVDDETAHERWLAYKPPE